MLMATIATLLDVVAMAVAFVLTFDRTDDDGGFDGGYDGGDAGGPSREAAGGGGGTEGVDHPAGAIPATMRAELRTVQTRQGALNVLLSHTACVVFRPFARRCHCLRRSCRTWKNYLGKSPYPSPLFVFSVLLGLARGVHVAIACVASTRYWIAVF